MTYKLSPSSLTLLEECPRCFWLQVVKKIRRPSGPMSSLPNGIDIRLKHHFDRFRENNEMPPELKLHKVDAKLFMDMNLLRKWRVSMKGIEYNDKDNDIYLHGAIDDLLEKDGKIIVLDFKTRGFDLKEDTAHMYQDKLNVYNFLLRKNGFKTHDYSYLLFYMPEKILESGEFVFKTELVKMNVNVEHAERLFQKAIKLLHEEEPPNPKQECKFCLWAKGVSDE